MKVPRGFAFVVLATAFGIAACSPHRDRPGPPDLTVSVPPGSTVFSPDTLAIGVIASDPQGLDSVLVQFLDSTVSLQTNFDTKVVGQILWPVPAGLKVGNVLPVVASATDVNGERTVTQTSVTVVAHP